MQEGIFVFHFCTLFVDCLESNKNGCRMEVETKMESTNESNETMETNGN